MTDFGTLMTNFSKVVRQTIAVSRLCDTKF